MEGVMNCLNRFMSLCLLDDERNVQLRRTLSNGDNVNIGIRNGRERLPAIPRIPFIPSPTTATIETFS